MPRKLCIFTERGPRMALAIAAVMVLGIVGPTSAQFFNFGGYQQRQQPQRGGGGFGGGWFGNDMYGPFQQHVPQPRRRTQPPGREAFSKRPPSGDRGAWPWR